MSGGLRSVALAAAVAGAWGIGGCATAQGPTAASATPAAPVKLSPTDPWERFNRAIFGFNESVDAAVLAPLARAYKAVVPRVVSQGFENVLGNVGDAWSAVNHALQGKPQSTFEMIMRVAVNSTFGLGGLLDIAGEAGIERQTEDFGQTLGRWGVPTGPYLVLPLIGASNVRDGSAWPLDRSASFTSLVSNSNHRYLITAMELIDTRAGLLTASSVLNQVALDRYTFVRDSYLARRRAAVYDGNPPPEPDDEPTDRQPAPK